LFGKGRSETDTDWLVRWAIYMRLACENVFLKIFAAVVVDKYIISISTDTGNGKVLQSASQKKWKDNPNI